MKLQQCKMQGFEAIWW